MLFPARLGLGPARHARRLFPVQACRVRHTRRSLVPSGRKPLFETWLNRPRGLRAAPFMKIDAARNVWLDSAATRRRRFSLFGSGRAVPFPGRLVQDIPNQGPTIPSLALAGAARYRSELRNGIRESRHMKAVVADALNSYAVVDVDLAPPKTGEVLVRMAATGVCHSDLSMINGTIPTPFPTVLGHEGAGVVEEVGDGVATRGAGRPRHPVLHPALRRVLPLRARRALPVHRREAGRQPARRDHPGEPRRRARCS